MDPLALAGLLALVEREQDRLCQQYAGGKGGDGDADPHGALPWQSGDRHQTAHALRDLIHTWARRVGTTLAKPRNAAIDNPRIDHGNCVIIDAKSVLDVRAVILDHNIGIFRQLEEDLAPFRALEVEGHRALLPVQVLKVNAVAVPPHTIAVGRAWWLDLDHVGAPARELAHCGRTCTMRREVEDRQMFERHAGHDSPFRLRAIP